MDEFSWIAALNAALGAKRAPPYGIGDDAAVLQSTDAKTVIATDVMVEGVHFRRAWSTLEDVAYKLYAMNASDMLAMGATPRQWLLTVVAPKGVTYNDTQKLIHGFERAQKDWGTAELIGGDSSRSTGDWMLSVTMMGESSTPLWTRHGAQVGDTLWIDGPVGLSAAGLAALASGASIDGPELALCVGQHRRPRRWTSERPQGVSAAIDVSDGLVQDIGHVARASGVQCLLDSPLPGRDILDACVHHLLDDQDQHAAQCDAWQWHGGEDYVRVVATKERLGSHWFPIGHVVAGTPGVYRQTSDGPVLLTPQGWNHFDQSRDSS